MVWNWEIFDDNLIKVVQALASNLSGMSPAARLNENLDYLSTFAAMQIFSGSRRTET
jgi:hypothetical protein